MYMVKDRYYWSLNSDLMADELKEEMKARGERYYNKKKRNEMIELIVCTVLGIAAMLLLMAITTN